MWVEEKMESEEMGSFKLVCYKGSGEIGAGQSHEVRETIFGFLKTVYNKINV